MRAERAPTPQRCSEIPEISRFFGVIIAMFYNDHEPPHFHARYGGRAAVLEIETLAVMAAQLHREC